MAHPVAGPANVAAGLVLPDAALAKEAFANLRPIGPLPAEPGRTFAGTLFEVTQPGGDTYRASLQVAPPFTPADPNWVSVSGGSQSNESIVTLSWEVLASQPGLAQFSRARSPIMTLLPNPQTKLYGVSAQLELNKIGTDRVQFVRRLGNSTVREEFSGNFTDLADELLRTKTTSAKTGCGTNIELCQFQGKPFTVQVQTTGPLPTGVTTSFAVSLTGVGLVVLIAGLVWLVFLLRIGGPAGKIVMLVVGVLLLLLAIAFAVIFAVRSISQDFEQAATAVEMPQPDQSSDNSGAAP